MLPGCLISKGFAGGRIGNRSEPGGMPLMRLALAVNERAIGHVRPTA